MENLEVQETEHKNELVLETQAEVYVKETAKWAKFLAIVGFVFMGILVLIAIITVVFSAAFSDQMPFPMSILGLVYILLAGVYSIPIYYLLQFANKAKSALLQRDTQTLSESFKNLKSHYKFIAIFTIVMLALYPIGIIVALIVGVNL